MALRAKLSIEISPAAALNHSPIGLLNRVTPPAKKDGESSLSAKITTSMRKLYEKNSKLAQTAKKKQSTPLLKSRTNSEDGKDQVKDAAEQNVNKDNESPTVPRIPLLDVGTS